MCAYFQTVTRSEDFFSTGELQPSLARTEGVTSRSGGDPSDACASEPSSSEFVLLFSVNNNYFALFPDIMIGLDV